MDTTTTTCISSKRNYNFSFAFGLLVILLVIGVSKAQTLSPNFYSSSCPQVYQIIKSAVARAIRTEPRMGASLLRLHYHDCFVNGCDASVLLDDTATIPGEKRATPNINSLRGFDVIDTIKSLVEMACPRTVSCADILAVAARDSVAILNGPRWAVGVGRRDSLTASMSAANRQLPRPGHLDLDDLLTAFSNKGLTATDLVALSGAHTIGQARCMSFRERIYNETDIDLAFATSRRKNCPEMTGTEQNNLAPLDYMSPNTFDNEYFNGLVNQRGLLHSDQQLLSNRSVGDQVRAYSTNSASFFNDFVAAMLKMSNLSVLTGSKGEIRANCRRRNSFSSS